MELLENIFDQYLNSFSVLISFSGSPVNVTCNIFINSFGSIAETTMVSRHVDFVMNFTLG